MIVFFAVQKLFSLMESHFSIFVFVACAFGVIFKILLSRPMSRSFISVFHTSSFTVSTHMFKSNTF